MLGALQRRLIPREMYQWDNDLSRDVVNVIGDTEEGIFYEYQSRPTVERHGNGYVPMMPYTHMVEGMPLGRNMEPVPRVRAEGVRTAARLYATSAYNFLSVANRLGVTRGYTEPLQDPNAAKKFGRCLFNLHQKIERGKVSRPVIDFDGAAEHVDGIKVFVEHVKESFEYPFNRIIAFSRYDGLGWRTHVYFPELREKPELWMQHLLRIKDQVLQNGVFTEHEFDELNLDLGIYSSSKHWLRMPFTVKAVDNAGHVPMKSIAGPDKKVYQLDTQLTSTTILEELRAKRKHAHHSGRTCSWAPRVALCDDCTQVPGPMDDLFLDAHNDKNAWRTQFNRLTNKCESCMRDLMSSTYEDLCQSCYEPMLELIFDYVFLRMPAGGVTRTVARNLSEDWRRARAEDVTINSEIPDDEDFGEVPVTALCTPFQDHGQCMTSRSFCDTMISRRVGEWATESCSAWTVNDFVCELVKFLHTLAVDVSKYAVCEDAEWYWTLEPDDPLNVQKTGKKFAPHQYKRMAFEQSFPGTVMFSTNCDFRGDDVQVYLEQAFTRTPLLINCDITMKGAKPKKAVVKLNVRDFVRRIASKIDIKQWVPYHPARVPSYIDLRSNRYEPYMPCDQINNTIERVLDSGDELIAASRAVFTYISLLRKTVFREEGDSALCYFWKYVAVKLQSPGRLCSATGLQKIPVIIVLCGDQGSGKSALQDVVSQLFNGYSVMVRNVSGRFDSSKCNEKLWMMGNDLTNTDDRSLYDLMKNLTESLMDTERKHHQAEQTRSFFQCILCVNNLAPLFGTQKLEPDDRRFFVVRVRGVPSENSKAIYDKILSVEHFYNYLYLFFTEKRFRDAIRSNVDDIFAEQLPHRAHTFSVLCDAIDTVSCEDQWRRWARIRAPMTRVKFDLLTEQSDLKSRFLLTLLISGCNFSAGLKMSSKEYEDNIVPSPCFWEDGPWCRLVPLTMLSKLFDNWSNKKSRRTGTFDVDVLDDIGIKKDTVKVDSLSVVANAHRHEHAIDEEECSLIISRATGSKYVMFPSLDVARKTFCKVNHWVDYNDNYVTRYFEEPMRFRDGNEQLAVTVASRVVFGAKARTAHDGQSSAYQYEMERELSEQEKRKYWYTCVPAVRQVTNWLDARSPLKSLFCDDVVMEVFHVANDDVSRKRIREDSDEQPSVRELQQMEEYKRDLKRLRSSNESDAEDDCELSNSLGSALAESDAHMHHLLLSPADDDDDDDDGYMSEVF